MPVPSRPRSLARAANDVSQNGLSHAVKLIELVCIIAGSRNLAFEAVAEPERVRLTQAVKRHDNSYLFNWLMRTFSFQGISDQVAASFMRRHGSVTWRSIQGGLGASATCPRLKSYWAFDQCGYDKKSHSCRDPEHIDGCPLPRHPLRNGRLNQTAYSLFFFMRDIAKDDFVRWIDEQLTKAKSDANLAVSNLVDPLRNIFGVSDKVLCMSLATLFAAVAEARPEWAHIGTQMVAVDTLVHNFLHRTGILGRLNANHPYGPRCYATGQCADILRAVSRQIDARRFNAAYPANFPRFVQHALWRYCAADGLNICNGNTIDDAKPCRNLACPAFNICDHITLKNC